jgi:hypothetical protein
VHISPFSVWASGTFMRIVLLLDNVDVDVDDGRRRRRRRRNDQ